MTPPALLPWKCYIDGLPEPHRSVFIHEFKHLLGWLLDMRPMPDHDGVMLQRWPKARGRR